jgi:O-antigen/teichoic acid export membrane protein
MRRFFVKNLLFVITLNLLVKPAWFLLVDTTVQNTVGHKAYGTYGALFFISVIFQILLDFGLTNYTSKTTAQQPDKLSEVFPAMFSARIVLALLYILVVSGGCFMLGYSRWEILLLLGILMFQALSSLLQFLRSNIAGLHKFRADGLLSILDRFLMIVICGTLLLIPYTAEHFNIQWFVWAQIISYATASAVAFYTLKRIAKVRLQFRLHVPTVLKIGRESLPYALLIFLMSVYTRADVAILERWPGINSKEQSGIYMASYRLLDVANMFPMMFATMLLPMFGRMLVQKTNIQPIIQLCVNLLLPFSLMVAIAAVFFGNPIMHLLYTQATDYDGLVFAWLMCSFPAFCMMYVYHTLLNAAGQIRLLTILGILGVVINITLNILLIPYYQALGCAIAAFVTQTVLSVSFIAFSGKKMQLPLNLRWISAHISFLLLALAVGYGMTRFSFSGYLQLLVYGVICLLLMFLFRFVSFKAVKQLAKNRASSV